jgi:hypothetical protein
VAERSVFISSCSRRELARRRPTRSVPWPQIALALLALVIAASAAIVVVSGAL